MTLDPQYNALETEAKIQDYWSEEKIFAYQGGQKKPVYSIDTPPPTISGKLHIGHVFSYTQTDVIARYKRMCGFDVFYPMGFDDNGLPTEILSEKKSGVKSSDVSREEFIAQCLKISEEFRGLYRSLWQSLGFSVDWSLSYSTISEKSRRISQKSFLDLLKKDIIYRKRMPSLWCTQCKTTIAQAELDSVPKQSTFYFFDFQTEDGPLPIASTRPELLPACVAVFIHPENEKFKHLIGKKARSPIFDVEVPILADDKADPEKGTGVVMCCTFGDSTDVDWFRQYNLELKVCIDSAGMMNELAGPFKGMYLLKARKAIVQKMKEENLITREEDIPAEEHMTNTHERCATPVEYLDSEQWFIRVLDQKEELLKRGEEVNWFPKYMNVRYKDWVAGLSWDWAISRQRKYGIPIPIWTCQDCKNVCTPEDSELPVNPPEDNTERVCTQCGGKNLLPDSDVLDTWATSSVTPQICAEWGEENERTEIRPMSMRPQAHDIIRTWAFYTILKSHYHFNDLPWQDAVISGHVVKKGQQSHTQSVAGSKVKRKSKISKSKDDGEKYSPQILIEKFSADCIRYWTCSSRLGTDVSFDEKEISDNKKLLTKLWNASIFTLSLLNNLGNIKKRGLNFEALTPVDRSLLSNLGRTVEKYHSAFDSYEFSLARAEVDRFFWNDFCDNYIEYVKDRLYKVEQRGEASRDAAESTLYVALHAILRLFTPFIPHICEEIFSHSFATNEGVSSIHQLSMPKADEFKLSEKDELSGKTLCAVIDYTRGHKSRQGLSLKQPISELYLKSDKIEELVLGIEDDICAITCSEKLILNPEGDFNWELLPDSDISVALKMDELALQVSLLSQNLRPFIHESKKSHGFKKNALVGNVEIYKGELSKELLERVELFRSALKVEKLCFVDDNENMSPSTCGELHARFIYAEAE